MRVPGNPGPAGTYQKVEIDTAICLQNVLDVELDPATRRRGHGFSFLSSRLQRGIVDIEIQLARWNVQRDPVSCPHQREGPSCRCLRCAMKDHGAIGSAAHA